MGGNRWFAQSTICAHARNIHRIARIISYIVRIIRWSEVKVITLSSVHRFNKAGARCSTNLAPLKCWGVEIVDFDFRLWLDLNWTVKCLYSTSPISLIISGIRHTCIYCIKVFPCIYCNIYVHFVVEELELLTPMDFIFITSGIFITCYYV